MHTILCELRFLFIANLTLLFSFYFFTIWNNNNRIHIREQRECIVKNENKKKQQQTKPQYKINELKAFKWQRRNNNVNLKISVTKTARAPHIYRIKTINCSFILFREAQWNLTTKCTRLTCAKRCKNQKGDGTKAIFSTEKSYSHFSKP